MPDQYSNPRRRRIDVITIPYDDTQIDRSIYIARGPTKIKRAAFVHSAAGTGTIQLTKCTGTQAPAAGAAVLAAPFSVAAAANTVTAPALTTTGNNLLLNSGDRLAIDVTTLVTVTGGALVVTLETY